MAARLAKIPAPAMAELDERSRQIITARFYRKPPILLDAIARELRISYCSVVTIAHKAIQKLQNFNNPHPLQKHIY
jgi:DNA-directed RNA polymerase sigma subunit (sigma70/sigma32)